MRIKYYDSTLGKFVNLEPLIQQPSIEFNLNAYGLCSFSYPLADPKSSFLQKRTEVQFYEDDVYIGGGKIVKRESIPSNPIPLIHVTAVGYIEEHANLVTIPNTLYNNEDFSDILDPTYAKTLIRVSGWATTVESTTNTFTYLTSLQSSLKTFQIVRRLSGFNYRYAGTSSNVRTMDFGVFGQDTGVRVRANPSTHSSNPDDYLVVNEGGLIEIEDSFDVVNKVYPMGAGSGGVDQLTLRSVDSGIIDSDYPIEIDPEVPNSDASYDPSVYDNERTGPNTYQAFYVKNQASIDEYGLIEKPLEFSDIYPRPQGGEYTTASRQTAANDLYKATVQYLKDKKDAKYTYQVTATGHAPSLKVGDIVSVKYKGTIKKLNATSTSETVFVDIDKDLFVTKVTLTWDDQMNKYYTLDVSNVNTPTTSSTEDVLRESIENVRIANKVRSGNPVTYPVYFSDSLDSSHSAKFQWWLPPETIYTDYVLMKVTVSEFRAYSTATGGGGVASPSSSSGGGQSPSSTSSGSHSHIVFNGTGSTGVTPTNWTTGTFGGGGSTVTVGGSVLGGNTSNTATSHSHVTAIAAHQHTTVLPSHTHSIDYGIYELGTPPVDLTISIDGQSFVTEMGNMDAFGSYPSGVDQQFNILSQAASLGILDALLTPGAHEIEVSCSSGACRIEISIFNQFFLSSR